MLTTKIDRFLDTRVQRSSVCAYLVAVESDGRDTVWGAEDSLCELTALVHTAGATVVGTMIQRLPHPDHLTYVGKGRAQELVDIEKQSGFDLLICDDELTPTQQRTLEEMFQHARVVDRTALILDIFAQHAHTREGQLQVELAQLEYGLPRLIDKTVAYSRQAGGSRSAGGFGGAGGAIGVRGPGETKLESDRRLIRRRISELKKEIDDIRRVRTLHRRQRSAQAIPVVAVVGYTNAGKSTLFNVLTSAGVLAENKLFATLDPVIRHITLPGNQEVLLSDTVGFIQKLPTKLIAAFRATLEEVVDADILLEVVDVSHENAIEQSETVSEILAELGAVDKPRITALNKIDLLDDPETLDLSLYPNAVAISALHQTGLDALQKKISEVLATNMDVVNVRIPFRYGDLVELFHRRGCIDREVHEMDGVRIIGRIPHALLSCYAPFVLAASY